MTDTTNTKNKNDILKLHTFEELEELYSVYINKPEDRDSIKRSFSYIVEKHQGQFRRSGEPYYHHLIEVAYILATLQCGPATLCAGLLHDVVEDTDTPIEEIKNGWGEDVAKIVDALTKIQRLKLSRINSEEFVAEDHRKIFLGMAQDVRVIIVKLADRLHNLRTLSSLNPDRQFAICRETLEVFIPIAHRLGINFIKSEMEDYCLKYLHPDKYKEIEELLKTYRTKSRKKSLDALTKRIADILYEHQIPFEIKSRVKSMYSIYEKIYRKGKTFDEIYDVLALRIITENEIQCYEILGLIHQTYRPIPGRFKDYIAMPKPNLYQSLHTSIVSGDGNIYEIQIRTKEMDKVAESGVAAHWGYKEGSYNSKNEQKEIENQLHWFRDFVSMSGQNLDENAVEYINSLTNDIFGANVYVFTPKGKVVELTNGATPLDFAYRIHTKVGETTTGAIVNNVMVPLNTVLKTGDVVEIKTSKNATGPNEKWLDFVATNNAKQCIRKYLFKKNSALMREEYIKKGKVTLYDVLRERGGIGDTDITNAINANIKKLLENFNAEDLDHLYLLINEKRISPSNIADFLGIKRVQILPNKKGPNISKTPVYCKGAGSVAINLASCCTPIPGDEIVGYITKGKGVTVHRTNCPNIANEKIRLIDVYWNEDLLASTYQVDIQINASDRNNLISDIMSILTAHKSSVMAINAKVNTQTLITSVKASILVSDADKLKTLFNALLNIKGVFSVERVIH